MRLPIAQLSSDVKRWLASAESFYATVVATYALPLAILHDSFDHAYVLNDFIYYCFTKSTKTLSAINLLLEQGFGEDAQILVRASYENYLAIAFIVAHPERLDDLVAKKVGLKTGDYSHPKTPNGRTDFRRIVATESGEIFPFGISVAEMAALTAHTDDKSIHRPLYGFLSEHCHSHMMASGNYRDSVNQRYTHVNNSQVLQARIYALYVYTITLAELIQFQKLKSAHRKRGSKLLHNGLTLLEKSLDILIFEDSLSTMPKSMKSRLKHCVARASDA